MTARDPTPGRGQETRGKARRKIREETPAERAKKAIPHPWEREALWLLWRAGWDVSELSMVFEVSASTVRRILEEWPGSDE